MKYIEQLQYITHDLPGLPHIEQAQRACEAGAKWIQYRCLHKNEDELLADIRSIAEICDDWGTTLIVTNHIHLNGKADIQGFHMEDPTADFTTLRNQVGHDITLGGSAHRVEELIRLAEQGVDYAGFGPFSTTETKPNNYPILGLAAYREAVKALKDAQFDMPILAVGGIKIYDVEELMLSGIHGIAVSGAINQADDFEQAYQDFYNLVKS